MELLPLSLTRSDIHKLARSGSGSISDKSSTERRKPNWTECENVFLLDQFSIHREILTCKATDASTNLRKQEVWRIICQNLNLQNSLVRRTPAEVRRKWKNLVTAAKKELWELRHQAHTTGAARKISELSQRVIQLHSSSTSTNNASALSALFLHHQNITSNSSTEDLKFCNSNNNNDYDKVSEYYSNGSNSHFTPIVQLSENVSSPTGSVMSSSDSRNEFDSGIYEEATDLRVNVNKPTLLLDRKLSEATTAEDITIQNRNSKGMAKNTPSTELHRVKLELQIDVLKLRKRKLEMEVRRLRRLPGFFWRRNLSQKNYNNNA